MASAVTLEDVALEAGIHASAVSRVLRDKDQSLRLSERRRQEIKDAAERLGYRRNSAAAATASGRFNSISLVCGTGIQSSTLSQALVYGLTDALADHEMQMVVTRLSDEALTDEKQLPLFLRQHGCDGLLLNYTHQVPAGVRDILSRYRIPSIWLNVKQEHDCVHPDDFAAGGDAARWLLRRGHTRVAYLDATRGDEADKHYSVADRRAGYAAALIDAGLEPCIHLAPTDLPQSDRVRWVRGLLASEQRPTAIMGYGDEVDAASIAAVTLGLSVPGDLDLVRFKEKVARFGGIPIPTIRLPEQSLGRAAVKALLKKIAHPASPHAAVAVPYQESAPTIDDAPPRENPPHRLTPTGGCSA